MHIVGWAYFWCKTKGTADFFKLTPIIPQGVESVLYREAIFRWKRTSARPLMGVETRLAFIVPFCEFEKNIILVLCICVCSVD